MKKYLLAILGCAAPLVTTTGFAVSIDMSLFSGGLSVLDSLLLAAIGLTLIGALLLCIALLKPEKARPARLEEPEPEAEPAPEETAEAAPAAESETTEAAEAADSETADSESPEADEVSEEPAPEAEAAPETPEVPDAPADSQEADSLEAEPAPEENGSYPRLTFTGVNNSDFKMLELRDKASIGRRSSNDLVFSDAAISGIHCSVSLEDGKVYLQDENSTNGTFLNGNRVFEKTEIHKGDILTLGQQEYRIGL